MYEPGISLVVVYKAAIPRPVYSLSILGTNSSTVSSVTISKPDLPVCTMPQGAISFFLSSQ